MGIMKEPYFHYPEHVAVFVTGYFGFVSGYLGYVTGCLEFVSGIYGFISGCFRVCVTGCFRGYKAGARSTGR